VKIVKRSEAYFRGCLLGGAIGDAFGSPVEFLSLAEIKERYGPGGITDLEVGPGGRAEITDDTQLTLFTAEGLLRAEVQRREGGRSDLPTVVYHAYLRWLHTQGYPRAGGREDIYDGWLLEERELHARRAPGVTCLSALLSGKMGTIEEPVNDSKGCGAVMRSAPVGLLYPKEEAFQIACECGAITHGHPSGYFAAGALAWLIAALIEGEEIAGAVEGALAKLDGYKEGGECRAAITRAVELATGSEVPERAVEMLGEGWVGEEALAIAIYSALKSQGDFVQGLIIAANYGGDSDSTAAIAGNILGAYRGLAGIPEEWLARIELDRVLFQMADDLLLGYQNTEEWRQKYPGR
jgi:ADP-ribosylglycohydrolase